MILTSRYSSADGTVAQFRLILLWYILKRSVKTKTSSKFWNIICKWSDHCILERISIWQDRKLRQILLHIRRVDSIRAIWNQTIISSRYWNTWHSASVIRHWMNYRKHITENHYMKTVTLRMKHWSISMTSWANTRRSIISCTPFMELLLKVSQLCRQNKAKWNSE